MFEAIIAYFTEISQLTDRIAHETRQFVAYLGSQNQHKQQEKHKKNLKGPITACLMMTNGGMSFQDWSFGLMEEAFHDCTFN